MNPSANAITNLAWPVVLTPANFDYTRADPSGASLYFTDAGGTALPHYVETWSWGGTSVVWVRVPNLAASSSTQIAMYYGGLTAARGASSGIATRPCGRSGSASGRA